MKNLKKTPLHKNHVKSGAKMSAFGGWDMPIYYSSIIAEHDSCRNSAAVFDISHMGEFLYEGPLNKFEKAFTRPLKDLATGKSRYSLILNDSGGIVDDLILFKLKENKVMVVTNASTAEKDFSVLEKSSGEGILRDISGSTAKIDIQGPKSRKILSDFLNENISLKYFNFSHFNYEGKKILLSRTGYTGELGYELFLPPEYAERVWDKLNSFDEVKLAGLGARDILRLEMGYSLYGHELDEDTTPLEAKLNFAVNFKHDFTGKSALLREKKNGISKKKIAFKTKTRRSPRTGWKLSSGSEATGRVTSGSYSPSLGCGIGMGYIKKPFVLPGENIIIKDSRDRNIEAVQTELPFYRDGSLRD